MQGEPIFTGSSLCVVGNINRDIKTSNLPAGDCLFQDGETSVPSVIETIGGGGANSAFAAASLGASVAFVGKVGADALGGRLRRTLNEHGIAAYLAQSEKDPSGTSIALAFENGHRHFVSCLPASAALSIADVDLNALAGRGHLLRADVWFSKSMLFEGNKKLFQKARQMGISISIDLNWDPCWGRANAQEIRDRKRAVRDVLPWVDLAHGNVRELKEFTEADNRETAFKRLADWGVRAVVVHLGDQGAGYSRDGSLIIEPPCPVNSRVNTTGTGDVLSVCMMLLHHRKDIAIPEQLRTANAIVAQFIEGKRQLIPALAD
jgi:sugar/nucleoside kinase (ribokinase family)